MNDTVEPVEDPARHQGSEPDNQSDGMGMVERFVRHILIPLLTAVVPILIALLDRSK